VTPTRTLACLAPAELQEELARGFAGTGTSPLFLPPPRAPDPGARGARDPFGVGAAAAGVRGVADALLVVASRGRSPHRALPGPVVAGLPVGIVFADRPEHLRPWLRALHRPEDANPSWAVMAMWQHSFLSLGRRFLGWLGDAHGEVESWFADELARDELCERLATGPALAVYLGHGRARGFCAYLGVRWHHVAAVPQRAPCGAVVSFACDTLKQVGGAVPFGCRWVGEGRAAAYVGAVAPVPLGDHALIAHEFGRTVADGRTATVGEVLAEVEARLRSRRSKPGVLRTFDAFRLIGHPLQSLHA
jgi:hypothetical protein